MIDHGNGLNSAFLHCSAILVREGETERRIEILAEPWVKPMTRKIYIQANIETQVAAARNRRLRGWPRKALR